MAIIVLPPARCCVLYADNRWPAEDAANSKPTIEGMFQLCRCLSSTFHAQLKILTLSPTVYHSSLVDRQSQALIGAHFGTTFLSVGFSKLCA
jgi:hypothetical protein